MTVNTLPMSAAAAPALHRSMDPNEIDAAPVALAAASAILNIN